MVIIHGLNIQTHTLADYWWNVAGRNNKERFSLISNPNYAISIPNCLFSSLSLPVWCAFIQMLIQMQWTDRSRHTSFLKMEKIATTNNTIIITIYSTNSQRANIATFLSNLFAMRHIHTRKHASNKYKLANKYDGITMTKSKITHLHSFDIFRKCARTSLKAQTHTYTHTHTAW